MTYIIAGKNIVKSFDNGKSNILNGIDISIKKGEFVSIMGASGSGKSTLLFALSGMDKINSGSVTFNGAELSDKKENELADIRRKEMGFVFQQPTMLKNLNLLDNIILPVLRDHSATRRNSALHQKRKNLDSVTQKAKTLMKKTGIAGLEQREITEVSGGQLQRAGICRALMSSPAILFADEPTGALNTKSADEIMILLSAIHADGAALLLVTHDAKVAAYADRVLFMKDGQIANELKFNDVGKENDVQKDPASRVQQILSEITKV